MQADPGAGTTMIWATELRGRNDVEAVAEGDVEVRRDDSILTADRVTYRHADDETEAEGNVRLRRGDDFITGPYLRLKIAESLGWFDRPQYSLKRMPKTTVEYALPREPLTASGQADRLDFEGEDLYRLRNATYSTCAPDRRDWYLKAEDIELDFNQETGEATGSTVHFKDTPILYWPWMTFPLNNNRRTGLLAPTFGHSTTNGLELTLPWYWNIAPNMDATIAPRVLTRRGLQINTEFRYLDHGYNGEARLEYLPNDQLAGIDRKAWSLMHNQTLAPGLTGNLNLNGVSDYAYFADLSSRVAMVSQSNLLRQGTLTYGAGWWNATLMAQSFQTLQDPAAPAGIPYRRLPQLTLNALRPDLPAGFTGSVAAEYVKFDHPNQLTGERTVLYPQLSVPWQSAAVFVTPKIGVHMTRYVLDRRDDAQLTREVPIYSIDSGMVFERNATWFDHAMIQTLEPRLFYLKVPPRDQSRLPVFDSALIDFNFAQIFSENRYGGSDRINDANQLTAAVVSRLVDPANGVELMRGAVGQRFYFRDQQVTLPGEVARTTRKTDLLAAFAGRVAPKLFVDTGIQYSPNFGRTERFNIGGRWQPESGKVLNAGYRYTRDQIGQIDVSGQWPLGGGWYGVGRYNHSIKEGRLIESLAGVEYDAGCWVGRIVFHRFATLTSQVSTSVFLQLELNGLARIGSNPLDMLKRNVPGYGVVNQPAADPVFGGY